MRSALVCSMLFGLCLSPARAASPDELARSALDVLRTNCYWCHGQDGKGTPLRDKTPEIPDFTSAAWQEGRNNAALAVSIHDGKGTLMPAFGGQLSKNRIRQLVDYLRSFEPTRKKPAASVSWLMPQSV